MVCGTRFAEPDTILVFEIFYEVFGGGTRLAMSKTICAPDSSSLKPGSGATEGVLNCASKADGNRRQGHDVYPRALLIEVIPYVLLDCS